jgi:hypothetical protein
MATCPVHGDVSTTVTTLFITGGPHNEHKQFKVPMWSCGCLPGAYESYRPTEPYEGLSVTEREAFGLHDDL